MFIMFFPTSFLGVLGGGGGGAVNAEQTGGVAG